ncbi:MAG: hypothetical protein ACI92W_003024 [Paraglaciecola sp.]|jgi:hypothetical protein
MRFNFTMILLPFLCLIACEVVELETTVKEPFISMSLLDGKRIRDISDSLITVQASADDLASQELALDNTIIIWLDSLEKLQAGIDTGNVSLENLFADVYLLFQMDSISSEELALAIATNSEEFDKLESIETILDEGLIKLDFIRSIHSGYVDESFQDSLGSYQLFLNINDTISYYEIGFNDNTFQLSLSHQNSEELNTDQSVSINFEDLVLNSYSFDSTYLICPNNNCNANTITLTCYY